MSHPMPPPPPPVGATLGTQQGTRSQNNNNGAMTLGQMQQTQGLGIYPGQLTQPRSSQIQNKQDWPKGLEPNQYFDVNEPVYEVYVLRRTKAFPDGPPSWRNPPNISMQRVSNSDMAELKKLNRNQYNGKRAPVLKQYDELKHDLMRDAVDQVVEERNVKEENRQIWQWDMALLDVKIKPVGNSMFPSKFETTQIRLVLKRVLKPGISPNMAANAMAVGSNGNKTTANKPAKPNGALQNQQYSAGLQGMQGVPPPPPLQQQMNGMYPPQQQQQQQQKPQQQQYLPQQQQQQQPQQQRPMNGQQPIHGAYPQPMMNIPAPPLGQFQPQQPTIQNNITMPAPKKNQNQNGNNRQQKNPVVEQKVKKYLEDMIGRPNPDSDSEDERRRRSGGRKSSQSSPRSSGALDHHRHHEHHRHSTTRRRRSDGYEFNDSYSSDFDSDEDSAYNTPPSSISDDRHRHHKDKYPYGSPRLHSSSRPRPREDDRYIEREVRRKSVYEDYLSPGSGRRPRNMVTRVLEYHHGQDPSSVDDLYDPRPLPRTLPLRPAISRSQSTRLPSAPAPPRRVPEVERSARDYVEREKAAYLAGRRQSQWETLSSEGGYPHGRTRQPIPRGALSDLSDSVYGGGRERHWRDEVEDEREWIRH
jgi:hypothetical protein